MRRRAFLESVGKAAGASAVYEAMQGLGLLASPAEAKSTAGQTFTLDGPPGRGRKILILGAGCAGMGAAYELGKKGYDCHILEARTRPGGRCHTIRRGTVEVERSGTRQVCDFDEGHYLNPGPARIAQHHVTLDYCRALGVAVEPFAQVNEAAYLYHDGAAEFGPLAGKRVRIREAHTDLSGYTNELLCKALSQTALDADLTKDDKERLLSFLVQQGRLRAGKYQGGAQRGYKDYPGAGADSGTLADPYAFTDLLRGGFGYDTLDDHDIDWQPTMMQVVGGTDGIAKGFARALGRDRITYEAKVTRIMQKPDGVTVAYIDAKGADRIATGEFCICAIPLSVLRSIPTDCAPEFKSAIAATFYAASAKIGLQFKRRFWEEDDRIFGGITRTNLPITQILYPSYGFLGRKGVLVGFYNFDRDASVIGRMAPADRLEFALKYGEKIHPQYRKEIEKSFSVAWQETPYSLGAWAYGGRFGSSTLLQPDGRLYLAGEHMSHLTGWMAGALESARLVSRQIHERASKGTA